VTDRAPAPGHAPCCLECRQFSRAAWCQGHVAPCRANRWVGTRRYKPTLRATADGWTCDEFCMTSDHPSPTAATEQDAPHDATVARVVADMKPHYPDRRERGAAR